MRRTGLILAVSIFVVTAATACSGDSGRAPVTAVTAGSRSPAILPSGSSDGSGSAGPAGKPGNVGPAGEPGNDGPTSGVPAGNGPADTGADTGSSGGGGRWPSVFNSWTGGGDSIPDCETFWRSQNGTPSSPYVGDGSTELTMILGTDRQICLAGFDTHSDIALTIARPDGSRQAVTVVDGQDTAVGPTDLLTGELADVVVFADHGDYLGTDYAQLEPSMPAGTYTLTAEQGELSGEAVIELQLGPLGDPELRRLKPQDTYEYAHSVRVGDQLTVLLLYFPPHATVPLALYRNTGVLRDGDGFDFDYVRELSTVTVNDQGWAYHTITVPEALPAVGDGSDTDYCVVTVPDLLAPFCEPGVDFTFSLAG